MNFDQAIQRILSSEGGFTDDPDDSGNWTGGKIGVGVCKGTKWGISAASYPTLDIKNLTQAVAIKIYLNDFWLKYRIASYPDSIRLHMLDVSINSGNARAVKILQRAVGFTGADIDGDAGPQTMARAAKVDIWDYHNERNDFYIVYADLNPVKRKYLKGWIRRVVDVTEFSINTK